MRVRLPGPTGAANVGHLRRILRDPAPVLDDLRDRYGPVVGLGGPGIRLAIVGGAEELHAVLSAPTASYRWGHRFNVIGFVVGDGSMIVSDGAEHRRRRGAVQAAFGRRRLHNWVSMIVDTTDQTIDTLENGLGVACGPIDLHPVGRTLVLRIVVRALFGARLAERAEEIGDRFERPQRYLESPAMRQIPHPFPFTARARVRADRRALDAIIDTEIVRRRNRADAASDDILESLVHDGSLSDAEIRDQVVTLLGAGYDSTSASLAWMLWRAGLEPGIWERLRVEADTVLPPHGTPGRVDAAHLAKLETAASVMRETLRLHPAGLFAPRLAATDLVVGDHRITKGTLVLWSPYLAGRDADTWPEPFRFDPDRFTATTATQKAVIDRAWIPFGKGPRLCIGFALAQMELTLIIARLAQRLDITPVGGVVPRPVGMVVNRPEGGVPAVVSARGYEVCNDRR